MKLIWEISCDEALFVTINKRKNDFTYCIEWFQNTFKGCRFIPTIYKGQDRIEFRVLHKRKEVGWICHDLR